MPSGFSAEAWSAAAYRVRAAGAAFDREQVVPGVSCAAVPVRTATGRVTAALCAVVPPQRQLSPLVVDLTSAAQAVGAALVDPAPDWRVGPDRAADQ
jgi:DNA-binding IclR family transcriptional regulator